VSKAKDSSEPSGGSAASFASSLGGPRIYHGEAPKIDNDADRHRQLCSMRTMRELTVAELDWIAKYEGKVAENVAGSEAVKEWRDTQRSGRSKPPSRSERENLRSQTSGPSTKPS